MFLLFDLINRTTTNPNIHRQRKQERDRMINKIGTSMQISKVSNIFLSKVGKTNYSLTNNATGFYFVILPKFSFQNNKNR